jgi:transcriptional regulator with XRE-family HTH domain
MESSRSTPLPGLAAHRRRHGLTQRQLGERAGVAHTTIQQLESLRRGAYPQTIQKLATALGVAPEELLHREYPTLRGTPVVQRAPSNHPPPNTIPTASREAIHE